MIEILYYIWEVLCQALAGDTNYGYDFDTYLIHLV